MAPRYIHEVFDITGNMKPDIIALQEAAHDLPAPWDDIEDICGREGGMMKESNLHVRPELPQIAGNHPQIVLVDPDDRVMVCFGRRLFRKQAVDLAIMLPVGMVKPGLVDKRKKNGPESFFGKIFIKNIDILFGQRNA